MNKSMNWSPIEMSVLLWYYYAAGDWLDTGPAADTAIVRLTNNGLLEKTEENLTITDKGRVLVRAWGNTPEPVQTWAVL